MQRAADISVRGARRRRCAPRRAGMREYDVAGRARARVPPARRRAGLRQHRRRRRQRLRAALPRQQRADAATATWCWSTPAPNTAATPPTSRAPFRSTGASRRSSARCTTWCCAAQAAALAQARPGAAYDAGHEAAVRTLTEGLLPLGLLKGTLETEHRRRRTTSASTCTRPGTGSAWTCTTSATTGSTASSRLLEPGMVFTIEPGPLHRAGRQGRARAKWRGIGIRIEDDVLVTADGHRVLTETLARSADEIEALMAAVGRSARAGARGRCPRVGALNLDAVRLGLPPRMRRRRERRR